MRNFVITAGTVVVVVIAIWAFTGAPVPVATVAPVEPQPEVQSFAAAAAALPTQPSHGGADAAAADETEPPLPDGPLMILQGEDAALFEYCMDHYDNNTDFCRAEVNAFSR